MKRRELMNNMDVEFQATMTLDDSNVNQPTTIEGEISNTIKSWIKGRRCLVKNENSNDSVAGVYICYLGDDDSSKYHDGTTAKLDGTEGQWMTDIPEYWYKAGDKNGKHYFTLSTFKPSDYQDSNDYFNDNIVIASSNEGVWHHSRRVLVGVTELVNNNGRGVSRKKGNEKSTASQNRQTFHSYAAKNGTGWGLIDYETHLKICHLFYMKYQNVNPQAMSEFSTGESSYTRTIGTTSTLGNKDGHTSDNKQISFLGIEDFYGGKWEFMDGITSNHQTYYIYDGLKENGIPDMPYRIVTTSPMTAWGYIKKVVWGGYGDMIPKEVGNHTDFTKQYCDAGAAGYSGWRVAGRSYHSANLHCGVAYFGSDYYSSNSYADFGSRVQYRGPIKVIDNVTEFKNKQPNFSS